MPDNLPQNPAPPAQTQPQQAPPPPSGAAPSAPERPSWLPEGFNSPEELATRYRETSRRLSEVEPVAKRWERWGDPDQFEQTLAQRITAREKQLREQWEAQYRQQQQAQHQADPYQDWELKTPAEQAAIQQRLVEQAVTARLQEMVNGYWNQAQGRLNDTDQRFNILSRLLMEARSNPDLDTNRVLAEAANLTTGDPNKLMELAIDRSLSEARQKKAIADALAAEKQKWEQERKNAEQAHLTGLGSGATASSFKDTIAARQAARGNNSRTSRILQKALEQGWITPGQV